MHGVAEHFGRAQDTDLTIPPDLSRLPRPIIGFVGAAQWNSSLARTEFITSAQRVLISEAEQAQRQQETLRAEIEYGFSEAKTTYGTIGVQVLVFKGETLGKGEQPATPAPEVEREKKPARKPGVKHAAAG